MQSENSIRPETCILHVPMYTFHTTVHYTFLYIICILYVFSHIQIDADPQLNRKIFWIVRNDKIIFL